MDLQLEGKIIIVTGGASGIGESICKKLAEEGAIPCIFDHNENSLLKVSADIRQLFNVDAFTVKVELTDEESCKNAVAQVVDRFGQIDGLVNNAGINDGVGLENGDYTGFVQSLEKNVGHYFTVAHLALPSLKESKGSLVNICSKTALTGQGGTSGYAAANGVRIGLTEEWSREWREYGINVNAVIVAECWTPQYEWWINQQENPAEKLLEITSKIPLENRMTSPGEVADTVLFLLSSNSKPFTGQLFYVDGGYVSLDRAIKGREQTDLYS